MVAGKGAELFGLWANVAVSKDVNEYHNYKKEKEGGGGISLATLLGFILTRVLRFNTRELDEAIDIKINIYIYMYNTYK